MGRCSSDQSHRPESTQGTHRTPSAPRQSARLTPPVPVPSAEKADEMILQDMIQVSLAEHKSREEQEARENVSAVYKHMQMRGLRSMLKILRKLMIFTPLGHIAHSIPDSSSYEPKLTKTNRLLSLIKAKPNRFKRYKSFFHELQGRYGYLFAHLKKRFMPRTSSDQLADNLHDVMMETLPHSWWKEKRVAQEKTTKEETERLISKAILQERGRMQAHISSQIQNAIDNAIPSLVDAFVRSYMSGHILHVSEPEQVQSCAEVFSRTKQHNCNLAMKEAVLCPEKIVLSLHKFPAIVFNDDDIEERTSRWVNKCIKKFNPYARYGVEKLEESSCEDFRRVERGGSSVIWERVHDFQLGIQKLSTEVNLTAL
ncbi:hypothetical protein Tco_0014529 [Tanacetum coccineum]